MAITMDEVLALGEAWCDTLRQPPENAVAVREGFFLHHPARIYVQNQGLSMSLEEHGAYHADLARQVLRLGEFTLTQLGESPDRARAVGSLYWEGHFKDPAKPPLRCVVGEDWLLPRDEAGAVKFQLWLNTSHHFLAESSVQGLEL